MPGWRLFVAERTELLRRSLRRYAGDLPCGASPLKYHNAETVIDAEAPIGAIEEVSLCYVPPDLEEDPRWPRSCPCGRGFHPEESWQVSVERLYKGAPDNKLHRIREFPVGAAWEAPWLEDDRYKGPDGRIWCVRMPGGGDWIVHGPSADGGHWSVEGAMPEITVSPSIGLAGVYHGFIKRGVISEDVDGRAFPGVPRTA